MTEEQIQRGAALLQAKSLLAKPLGGAPSAEELIAVAHYILNGVEEEKPEGTHIQGTQDVA